MMNSSRGRWNVMVASLEKGYLEATGMASI